MTVIGQLDVGLAKGPVPPNQPNAYNAVEVMRNLEPKLDR
jgi:hypothetical protein